MLFHFGAANDILPYANGPKVGAALVRAMSPRLLHVSPTLCLGLVQLRYLTGLNSHCCRPVA